LSYGELHSAGGCDGDVCGFARRDSRCNGVPDFLRSVAAAPGDVTSAADPTTRMKQLQNMKDAGLITNDEYEAKRTQILDKL